VSLLRAHAAEHLLLSAAYRSLPYHDVLLLGNDTVLSRDNLDPAIARLVSRVIDDVICVLRDVSVDDVEVACLKAIIFFDPGQWPNYNDQSEIESNQIKLEWFNCLLLLQ